MFSEVGYKRTEEVIPELENQFLGPLLRDAVVGNVLSIMVSIPIFAITFKEEVKVLQGFPTGIGCRG